MARHFVAAVPQGLTDNVDLTRLIAKLKRTMRERGQESRWTPPGLWHVTIQFLGDVPEELSGDVSSFFERWEPQCGPIELRLQGLGAFPSPEEARVLWVGVKESQQFIDLQSKLLESFTGGPFILSEKEFKPHLTLARFRNAISVHDLVQMGARKYFGDYRVNELVLFKSVLQGNIIKYVPLMRKALVERG